MSKEVRSVSATGGEKGVKVQAYDRISAIGLTELAKLYGVGAGKYADHNFRRGYEWSKSYASLQRHANLFWSGEDIDQEMNIVHMSPVAWHAIALTEFLFVHPDFDDRPIRTALRWEGTKEQIGEIPVSRFEGDELRHEDYYVRRGTNSPEPRFDLIPLRPLALLASFYGEGHAEEPLKTTGHLWSNEYARIQEYANRFWWGENVNPQTGHLNTTHVLHHALTLIELWSRHKKCDDRLIDGAAPIGYDSVPVAK